MRIAIDVFIVFSIIFALAGVIGMLRMPDAYCRMQSSTNIATFGVLGVIIGSVLYSAFILHDGGMTVKLIGMGVFYIITAPISGHAIAKGAYHHRVEMDEKTVCDAYGEDMVEEE